MGPKSAAVVVSPREKVVLEGLVRARSTPQHLAERCRIVLLSAEDWSNEAQAGKLGVDRQRVRRWRRRWSKAASRLSSAEAASASESDFAELVIGVLSDDPRSGAPAKFSPEQVTDLIALACEPPAESGLPISHWTPPELAREAVKRGIVASISPRQVDRFLSRRTSVRTRASIG